LPTIRVPDLTKATDEVVREEGLEAFDVKEYEVNASQAAKWNGLNEKEKLTLVLRADREHKDVRDYL